MCGRFSFAPDLRVVNEHFEITVDPELYKPRYNCAPTQNLAIITNTEPEKLSFFKWGLIPFWAKDISIGSKLINARAETLLEKPSFRNAFSRRRCLVPADSFYEWSQTKPKVPFRIRLKHEQLFSMAGLWENWKGPSGESVNSFTIITTSPNKMMSGIHSRMPAILPKKSEKLWLGDLPVSDLINLIQPYPDELMEVYEISTMVNSVFNDRVEIWSSSSPG